MSDHDQEAQNPDAPAETGGQRPAGNISASADTRYIRSLEGIIKLVIVVSYTRTRYSTTMPWHVAWLISISTPFIVHLYGIYGLPMYVRVHTYFNRNSYTKKHP